MHGSPSRGAHGVRRLPQARYTVGRWDRTEPSRYRLFRTKEDVIIFLPANFSEQFPVEVLRLSRHQARANVVGSRAASS